MNDKPFFRADQVGSLLRPPALAEARAKGKAGELPPEAVEAIRDDVVDGVVLYSPRTAAHFRHLLSTAELNDHMGALTLFALSKNVLEAAGEGWEEVIVAAQPDQESLLEAVRSCYG